jgi:MFS family permease
MVSAPLSETYGRRFIYIFVTPLALLFIMGAGFAKNLATLTVCRLLAGILVSAPLAVGAGTIMDIWTGVYTNRGVVLLMAIAFMGPALGSLVGGWIAEYKDWPWSQWTTVFLGAGIWVFSLGAQETYPGPIIRRRAKKLGLPVPPAPIPGGLAGVRFLVMVTLARPVYMLLTEPIVALCSLYSSLNFSVLFCFLASVPLIYSTTYGFSPGQCGLVFIGIPVGCVVGATALILIDSYTLTRHRARYQDALPPPERLLWGAMLGGPLMPAALFWFAWTARPGVHWMSSIMATALFGCSNILIFVGPSVRRRPMLTRQVSTALYLTNVYGAKYGASALAANGLLRYAVGGSFPLFTIASMLSKFAIESLVDCSSVQKSRVQLGLESPGLSGCCVRSPAMDILPIWNQDSSVECLYIGGCCLYLYCLETSYPCTWCRVRASVRPEFSAYTDFE